MRQSGVSGLLGGLCLTAAVATSVTGAALAGPARPPSTNLSNGSGTPEISTAKPLEGEAEEKNAREALAPAARVPGSGNSVSPGSAIEVEPPSPVPWIVATATSIGMLLAASWAAVERRRARLVSEELSRIRLHRTAGLRVTQPLGKEKEGSPKPPL